MTHQPQPALNPPVTLNATPPQTVQGPQPGFDPRALQQKTIEDLLAAPGLQNIEASRNFIRGDASTAIRDQALRRSSQSAARGLFGSGLQQRDLRQIEQDVGQQKARSLNDLEGIDSTLRQQGVSTALSSLLGMSNLDLQKLLGEKDLDLRKLLGLKSIAAQRAASSGQLQLGQGQLDLSKLRFQSQQQEFEFLQNLLLGQFPGFDQDQVSAPQFDLSELLGNLPQDSPFSGGVPGGGGGNFSFPGPKFNVNPQVL